METQECAPPPPHCPRLFKPLAAVAGLTATWRQTPAASSGTLSPFQDLEGVLSAFLRGSSTRGFPSALLRPLSRGMGKVAAAAHWGLDPNVFLLFLKPWLPHTRVLSWGGGGIQGEKGEREGKQDASPIGAHGASRKNSHVAPWAEEMDSNRIQRDWVRPQGVFWLCKSNKPPPSCLYSPATWVSPENTLLVPLSPPARPPSKRHLQSQP